MTIKIKDFSRKPAWGEITGEADGDFPTVTFKLKGKKKFFNLAACLGCSSLGTLLSSSANAPRIRSRSKLPISRRGSACLGCACVHLAVPPSPSRLPPQHSGRISLLPRASPAQVLQPSPSPARGPSWHLVLQIKMDRGGHVWQPGRACVRLPAHARC